MLEFLRWLICTSNKSPKVAVFLVHVNSYIVATIFFNFRTQKGVHQLQISLPHVNFQFANMIFLELKLPDLIISETLSTWRTTTVSCSKWAEYRIAKNMMDNEEIQYHNKSHKLRNISIPPSIYKINLQEIDESSDLKEQK